MKRIHLFFLSFLTWLLLVWKFDAENVFAGIIVAAVSAIIFGNMGAEKEKGKEKGAGTFSPVKIVRFAGFIVTVLALWIEGALTQVITSLFSTVNDTEDAGQSGMLWVVTGLKKPSSKFFLTHALYYAPSVIVVDFTEESKVFIKWSGGDERISERTEKIVRELEKKIAGIFE